MPDFSRRADTPELMDGDDVSPADFADCMADLAQVNSLTLARGPTLRFVDAALAASPTDRPLTILDVGYGAGDMLRAIARLGQKRCRALRLVGYDINPRSEPVANRLTHDGMHIEFRTGNAFDWPESEPPDLVISSLVTHHMDDAEIVRFLTWMEGAASRGWFVNDLLRNRFAWHGFKALAATMRWHRFVRHDGPVSITRAFRRGDWQALLGEAGLADVAQIEPRFPFRLCVARRKW